MTQSNMYGASAADIWDLFCDYVSGNPAAVVLALSSAPLGDAAQTALDKSFSSFGYGSGACAFALTQPSESELPPLDPQALFMLVEGLDPVCLVCADEAAAYALEGAYHLSLKLDAPARIFGRPTALFRSLDNLMESPDGKQKAWSVLKTLPRA